MFIERKATTAATERECDLPASEHKLTSQGEAVGSKFNRSKKNMEVMTRLCVTKVNVRSHFKKKNKLKTKNPCW